MRFGDSRGFGLLESLVSLAILGLALGGIATLLIQNSLVNRREQLKSKIQADARGCLSLVVQHLRSAGWNPYDLPFEGIVGDSDLTDEISWIEIRADLTSDGDLDDDFEQLVIRHMGTVVEWRKSPDAAWETVTEGITNDADGDGVAEPMFIYHGDPVKSVDVIITAESTEVDPGTGEFMRYTVETEVTIRSRLLPLR